MFIVPHANAWLCPCLIAVTLSGCAFPLFNMEERARPRTLAYRPTSHVATSVAPPSERRSEPARPTPTLGPRKSSVLDPSPRELGGASTSGACYASLRDAGVAYERVSEPTPGVRWPIRLKGPVRGVLFEPVDHDRTHAVLDCRLALSLVSWSRDLRRARVRKLEYYSMYRPGARVEGTSTVSGHAHAMAIDAARFELDSGVVLDVLNDWEERERGGDPCPVRRDETSGSRTLRSVLCQAVDRKLFEVILTPHYNKAHANHLHLERKPDVDWLYVR